MPFFACYFVRVPVRGRDGRVAKWEIYGCIEGHSGAKGLEIDGGVISGDVFNQSLGTYLDLFKVVVADLVPQEGP